MRTIPMLLLVVGTLSAVLACDPADTGPTDVAVQVGYVAMDPTTQSPVVVLEERDGVRLLPIWIGFAEARSIAAELNEVRSLRPGAHDLAKRLIDGLDGRLERVVVNDLSKGVYYARLLLDHGGRQIEIDARPSDAIAIALRTRSPLFVRETVFDESRDASTLGLEAGRGI